MSQCVLSDHISALVKQYGSFRAAGQALEINHVHLWRLYKGQKNPSEEALAKLGIERTVTITYKKKLMTTNSAGDV